jgi:hypothetical protein
MGMFAHALTPSIQRWPSFAAFVTRDSRILAVPVSSDWSKSRNTQKTPQKLAS